MLLILKVVVKLLMKLIDKKHIKTLKNLDNKLVLDGWRKTHSDSGPTTFKDLLLSQETDYGASFTIIKLFKELVAR